MNKTSLLALFLLLASAILPAASISDIDCESCIKAQSTVVIIGDIREGDSPVQHGLEKLCEVLKSKDLIVLRDDGSAKSEGDFFILAGLSAEENPATLELKKQNLRLPDKKEGLRIQTITFKDRAAVVLCGADEVGLMYAALDVAKRISWSEDPELLFEHVSSIAEAPDVQERAVSAGSFHRKYFEERLYDEKYWEAYFDMMAEHRLNQFLLIFGYKNNQYKEPNFMAPAYPNFFNLEEYPDIKMVNISEADQERNREALKKIISLAHARGIEFGVGLWDQIERDRRYLSAVKAGIEKSEYPPENIIWGLTQENLIPYSKLAIRKFFQTFPDIDLVQFRMHWEAGITGEVALQFWKEIFDILKEECPDIKIEARAKDVPDETLYDGVDTGMDFRVATKHWMEQMGQPFHPTHVNEDNQHDRRHGYADLLRYPKKYEFKWRVWSGGTTRVFQWGDPEWMKLFAEGSHLYDAVGYEFNEPLYFKMNGSRHDAEVTDLLNPDYRYYTYEFERYWHYYQLLGRIGYNPDTSSDIWEMEFDRRFGKKSGPCLMDGLHMASKVLPRIVSSSYLYERFPSPQGWPELQRLGNLKYFAQKSKPSDTQQFASPMEEAELILNGEHSVKRLPSQTSDWFRQTSEHILLKVERAEKYIGEYRNNEYKSTVTDLKMLASLAKYHAERLLAAVQYNLYEKTGDLGSFDRAIALEELAVEAYGELVEAAGNVYNSRLDFGSNIELFPGHWSNEHGRLLDELAQLKEERAILAPTVPQTKDKLSVMADSEPPIVDLERISSAMPNESLKVTAHVEDVSGIDRVTLRYRRVSQFEDYATAPMILNTASGRYEAEIPATFTEGKYDVMYFVEAMDAAGNGRMYPDMEVETPYVVVRLDRKDTSVAIYRPQGESAIAFAINDIQSALDERGRNSKDFALAALPVEPEQAQIVLGLIGDKQLIKHLHAAGGTVSESMAPEGYAIRLTNKNGFQTIWGIGADATGAMYAGLSLAETITRDGFEAIAEVDCQPYIGKRGLKINVPLDARTPAYADCGDAAQKNMAVMWDINFWEDHLDAMARNRYNTITLWNAHPFPSMVKVPEYPDVALDDVMIADIDWMEWFPKYAGRGGSLGVTQEILDNLKVLKRMSMDEKIAFWREVMEYAHDRGIEFHIITWNIFTWAAEGKYGITHDVHNEVTVDYLRKSVKSLFETYPLLAGIGVTAGERMPRLTPDEKEQWLWKTYGLGVMDAKKAFPGRPIRFIHRYWMSDIPEITKHFEGFDEDIEFNFSYKYVKARLYSNTDPDFVDPILEKAPEGTKWWWNLRNDDIFYFRWGDPDFVREFIQNLPPADQTEGFHMGSDGYVWGREFVSTEPETPRQLEIDKHWYKFMLWGRLGYDPKLLNSFFEKAIQERFPGKPAGLLQEVWARASRIIPAINLEHWHDWDFQWAVESCNSRNGYHAITNDCWKAGSTGVADEIQAHAEFVLNELEKLRKIRGHVRWHETRDEKQWKRTLGDIEALAHLGNYYAEKFRAADNKEKNPAQAIEHLKRALIHWERYAEIGKQQYHSQLLSKGGWADWEQGIENAKMDIELMENMIPETTASPIEE